MVGTWSEEKEERMLQNWSFRGAGIVASGRIATVLPSKMSASRIQRSNGGSQASASGMSRSPALGTGEICDSAVVLGSICCLTRKMETSRRRLQEKDLPWFLYYFRYHAVRRGSSRWTLGREPAQTVYPDPIEN